MDFIWSDIISRAHGDKHIGDNIILNKRPLGLIAPTFTIISKVKFGLSLFEHCSYY